MKQHVICFAVENVLCKKYYLTMSILYGFVHL